MAREVVNRRKDCILMVMEIAIDAIEMVERRGWDELEARWCKRKKWSKLSARDDLTCGLGGRRYIRHG